MTQTQKYADGDSRRRFGGSKPVKRSTSRGRGSGRIGDSVLRATAWKDLGDAKVVTDTRPGARKGSLIAVDGGGAALWGSMMLMTLARFVRRGRGR